MPNSKTKHSTNSLLLGLSAALVGFPLAIGLGIIAGLIGGLFVVETVFNYPGIGTLLLTAIHDRDLPLVQSIAIVMAVIYVIANLGADLLTLVLNPRLRSPRAMG